MGLGIVHFGMDDCNRLMVLQNAGYAVDSCSSLEHLRFIFNRTPLPAAIVMAEHRADAHHDAIAFVRSHPPVPLVLFQSAIWSDDESQFDLVIPPLTPPDEWLEKIAALIKRTQAMLATSQQVREQSAVIRKEAAASRLDSVLRHERYVRQKTGTGGIPARSPNTKPEKK